MPVPPPAGTADPARPARGAVRKARTRAALVDAAQALLSEGRTEVSIEEITQRADVGLGSFYNHFADKAELWEVALAAALDAHEVRLATLGSRLADPAERVCVGIRLTGRMTRQHPQVASVLQHTQVAKLMTDGGLVAGLRRDIEAAAASGRFQVPLVEVAVAMAAGSLLGLLGEIMRQPASVAEEMMDDLTTRLLIAFGLDPAEARRLVELPLPQPPG